MLDCEVYPARVLAAAYRWRWDGSETGLRETKSLLDGAGPSTGPMLRSRSPLLVRQELAAWALAGELVRGLVRDAAHAAAPARKGRRAGQPVHPRQLSFTAARRAAITSIRQGTAAAGLPAAAVAAGTARLLAAVGRARHVTDRNRHRPRNTKARQAFEKAHRNKSQLIVYNHMWFDGEEWQCPGCTGFTSQFTRLEFLNGYDARFVIVTQGPIDEALAYKERVGNKMTWYSTANSPFGADVGAPPGGGFGVNVFLRDGDTVYRTWHTNGRGCEQLSHIGLIDLLPYGRQEQWQDSPDGWPQSPTYSGSQDIAAAYGPDA